MTRSLIQLYLHFSSLCGVLTQLAVLHPIITNSLCVFTVDSMFPLVRQLIFLPDWSGESCWLVPPVSLISRAICRAQLCSAGGTIVIPMWKSAPFWPVVCPDGQHLANFMHSWFAFKFYDCMFLPGLCGGNIGDSMTNDSVILALQFDFFVPVRNVNAGFCLYDETGSCNACFLSWSPWYSPFGNWYSYNYCLCY